jgi:hypothetical protein
MSHIDSFRHQIVGLFGPLPVYRPLEDIDGDFQCTTAQLLLGGGSGEHPAMVLKRPTTAAARYLHHCLTSGVIKRLGEAPTAEREAIRVATSPYLDQPNEDVIVYYEWSAATHEHFERLCRSDALPNRYPIYADSIRLEDWLILGLGEFVFFAMPDLAADMMSRLSDPYRGFQHVYFNNIMLIPPNMPVYANGGNAYRSHLSERGSISAADSP